MAISKVKRSVHKKQLAPTNRQPVPPAPASRGARRGSVQPKTKNRRTQTRSPKAKPAPGSLALLEKSLPHRRFVEFPLAKGRTVDKVQLFLTSDCNSLTIEFQDKTALALDIEPGLTINAEFQQIEKGDVQVLAEWPPIHSQT